MGWSVRSEEELRVESLELGTETRCWFGMDEYLPRLSVFLSVWMCVDE